jgi:PAS domain S-box-containing protein
MNEYSYFFDTGVDRVCFVNMEESFEDLKQNFTTILGYSASDLSGKGLFDLIHPEDIDQTKTEMKKLALGCGIVHFSNRCVMKSGDYTDLEWSVRANSDLRQLHASASHKTTRISKIGKNRKSSAHLSFIHDLDEKEKLTTMLLAANKKLHLLNEEKERRSLELVVVYEELLHQNAEGDKRAMELAVANKELVYQNAEKEKRAGELAIANQELDFQNIEREKRALELVVANEELLYQNAEKEKRAMELVIANTELIYQNEEKEKRAAELVIANHELDVQNKEREKRAKELQRAYRALEKAENHCREMNLKLEAKVKERTLQLENINNELEAFSYSVSHDLRAPIRAISGYTRIISEDYTASLDDDGLKALHAIMHNSKRMGELIDDLLAFSRLGRKEVRMSEINMAALVKSVREELVAADSGNVADFTVEVLPPALGDQSLIKQVLINLISNALKYSKYKENIRIHIGTYDKDGRVVYFIKDNGAGFDMAYYDQLFGVFQRLHSPDEFEGTGIGLAIVQKIVSRHQGTVWADSKPGEGACFYFSLPVISN